MSLTIAPSDEACQAIVARINSGSGITYTLASAAEYFYQKDDNIQRLSSLTVDVIHLGERDLGDTLDVETRTSHDMQIWIRQKLPGAIATASVAAVKLVARQIFQRVNNYATSRVRVWECGEEQEDGADRSVLRQDGVVSLMIPLRVVVEASS